MEGIVDMVGTADIVGIVEDIEAAIEITMISWVAIEEDMAAATVEVIVANFAGFMIEN
jgi:hypothetical protein